VVFRTSCIRVYKVLKCFTYRIPVILCQLSSVLHACSQHTFLWLNKVSVEDRQLQRWMPSIWVSLNYCVEYNIVFYCAFIIYLIIKPRYTEVNTSPVYNTAYNIQLSTNKEYIETIIATVSTAAYYIQDSAH
jgi:hypothetical protein